MLRKSDEALCAAVRDGHDAAFAAIAQRYRSQLLRHCRSLLRDGHAEDAVQQTFVRALQALRAGTEVRELGPWLHRIARNVALSELTSRGRYTAELSEEWEDRGRADEFERRADLRAALVAMQELPTRQRTALLRSVAGQTPAQIAHDLGVSSMAVRQLVHRARVTVRAAVNVFTPPPLVWLARRFAAIGQKVPRAAAGAPAGAAPLATKVAVVVVASASIAAPAAVIHTVLSHRAPPRHTHHHALAHRSAGSAPVRPYVAIAYSVPAPIEAQRSPALLRRRPARKSVIRRTRKRPSVDKPAPARAQVAALASPPSASQPSQAAGVSASSPGAPVGTGSSAGDSAGSGASSGTGGSPSAGSGPIATASATGPTGQ
jgi:RNA polymerase sigma factor (sigma-70 family)